MGKKQRSMRMSVCQLSLRELGRKIGSERSRLLRNMAVDILGASAKSENAINCIRSKQV